MFWYTPLFLIQRIGLCLSDNLRVATVSICEHLHQQMSLIWLKNSK